MVSDITKEYPIYFTKDFKTWLEDERNLILKEGRNLAFAEYKSHGVYWVHFCFDTCKGKEAIGLTKEIFKFFCETAYVKVVVGLIAADNKPAKWVIRQAGFTSLGTTPTTDGTSEMFFKQGNQNGFW